MVPGTVQRPLRGQPCHWWLTCVSGIACVKAEPCLIAFRLEILLNTKGISNPHSQTTAVAQGEEETPPPSGKKITFSKRVLSGLWKERAWPLTPGSQSLVQHLRPRFDPELEVEWLKTASSSPL